MKLAIKRILPMFMIALLSVSCGGSGDGTTASGGIGGTGISQGTITKLGSVTVNGVKFNTDSATFTIDDNTDGLFSDLKKGMVVKVHVDDSGTKATKVEFEAEVEGPVDSRDPVANSLVVLGRTVVVDDSTKFEGTTGLSGLDPLSDDDMLEVSGLVFLDDKIQATHIKKKTDDFIPDSTEVELKGTVKTFDKPTQTFFIGNQKVDYSAASFIGIIENDLANAPLVEVEGKRGVSGTTLMATKIKKEDNALGANKVEIEGLVSEFVSKNAFKVNGQAVDASSAIFEDGAPDDIADNVRLEVEGTITAGILVAKKVKFHGNRIKIEANVESVNSAANTVTLLGNAVVINGATEIKDKDSGGSLPFSAIQDGDRLEIRGYLSNNVVTATRVELNNGKKGDPVRLQAPVETDPGAGSTLTLLGVTVNTSFVLDKNFKNTNDQTIGRTAFFNQVKAGDLVKVKGTLSGANIDATEVEFED